MEREVSSKWLKLIIVGMAICGAIVCAVVIPAYGRSLATAYPEFANRFWPWLAFLWAAAIPCFAALAIGWGIAGRIGRGRPFSIENAGSLRRIARLAAGDAIAVFAGNVVLLLLDMSHPGVLLMSLLAVFAGVAVAVGADALSRLTRKAAVLQEQSSLTV